MPDDINKPIIGRCEWVGGDPLMQAYHDDEWGLPVHDSRLLWETLMLECFQAGLSWAIVLKRRDSFREAFKNFAPELVAEFGDADIERLLSNSGIVRSRAKIEATIQGARVYLAMRESGEEFSDFAWSFVGNSPLRNATGEVPAKTPLSKQLSIALKKRGFKFVGPTITYAWMQAVGLVDDHLPGCFRYRQLIQMPPAAPAREEPG